MEYLRGKGEDLELEMAMEVRLGFGMDLGRRVAGIWPTRVLGEKSEGLGLEAEMEDEEAMAMALHWRKIPTLWLGF